jgi:hypothetical protein
MGFSIVSCAAPQHPHLGIDPTDMATSVVSVPRPRVDYINEVVGLQVTDYQW